MEGIYEFVLFHVRSLVSLLLLFIALHVFVSERTSFVEEVLLLLCLIYFFLTIIIAIYLFFMYLVSVGSFDGPLALFYLSPEGRFTLVVTDAGYGTVYLSICCPFLH